MVWVAEQGEVTKLWHIPTKILIKQLMLWCRREPLLAPDHVRDPHQVIIDNICEVIRGQTVGLHQYLHIDLGPGIRILPRSLSLNTQSPSVGIRIRTTNSSPLAFRASASAADKCEQRPSYRGVCFAAICSARIASRSCAEQKQRNA